MNGTEYSLIDIAPTISGLLDIPMLPPAGKAIASVESLAKEKTCKKVVIIIVDSLGYYLYRRFFRIMENIRDLEKNGLLFKCRSPARHTSPAIASIFTGYPPEEHRIYATGDLYVERAKDPDNPKIKSILEWAYEAGMNSSIVIESEGAETFRGKVRQVYGVSDSEDILDYDRKITGYAVEALRKNPILLAVHLRALDRFSHRARNWEELKVAAKAVDENIKKIRSVAGEGTLFFICGDHVIHGGDKWLKQATEDELENHRNNLVALIVGFQ